MALPRAAVYHTAHELRRHNSGAVMDGGPLITAMCLLLTAGIFAIFAALALLVMALL